MASDSWTFSTANKYITGRIRWVQTSNGDLYNSSKVKVYLDYKKSTSSSEETNGRYVGVLYCSGAATDEREYSFTLSYSTFKLPCDGKWKNMASYTFTVKHDGAGKKSCTVGLKDGHCTNGNSLSDPQTSTKSITLDAITLSAPTVTLSTSSISQTSWTIKWSTNTYYNKVEYNVNSGSYKVLKSNTTDKSGTFTLSDLTPGKKYTVGVRITRTDATSKTTTKTISATTVTIPKVTVPSLSFALESSASNLKISVTGRDKGSVRAVYTFINDAGTSVSLLDTTLAKNTSTTSGTIILNLENDATILDKIYSNCQATDSITISLTVTITGTEKNTYTSNYLGKMTVPTKYKPVFGGFSCRNVDDRTLSLLGANNDYYIPQGFGKMQIKISVDEKAVGQKYAYIKNYTISIRDSGNKLVGSTVTKTYSDSETIIHDIGTTNIPGTYTVQIYATDSRKYTSSVATQEFIVLPYSAPKIGLNDLTISRQNNFEKELILHCIGSYSNLLIGNTNYNSNLTITYIGKNITDKTATIDENSSISGSLILSTSNQGEKTSFSYKYNYFYDGNGTNNENIITVNSEQIWQFTFTIKDNLSTIVRNVTVEQGMPIMSVIDNGMVGVNMVPDVTDTSTKLQVNGDISSIAEDGRIVRLLDLYDRIEHLWERFYPVGSIYMSVKNTNPSSFLGGTWVAWGAGRVPVGVDANQTEFDKVEETGGSKTVTLTVDQMPSHTHTQKAHNHTQNAHSHKPATKTYFSEYTGTRSTETIGGISGEGWEISQVNTDGSWSGSQQTASTTATNKEATAINQNTGGGKAHSNLQPYITCYMWKRTA